MPVNRVILRDQACDLVGKLECGEEFKCSNEWFSRFKVRRSLTYLKDRGESGSVDEEVMSNWRLHMSQALLQEYGTDDIFSLDKAVRFYKMLPGQKKQGRNRRKTVYQPCLEQMCPENRS